MEDANEQLPLTAAGPSACDDPSLSGGTGPEIYEMPILSDDVVREVTRTAQISKNGEGVDVDMAPKDPVAPGPSPPVRAPSCEPRSPFSSAPMPISMADSPFCRPDRDSVLRSAPITPPASAFQDCASWVGQGARLADTIFAANPFGAAFQSPFTAPPLAPLNVPGFRIRMTPRPRTKVPCPGRRATLTQQCRASSPAPSCNYVVRLDTRSLSAKGTITWSAATLQPMRSLVQSGLCLPALRPFMKS